jgi:hypothetical protein
MGRLQRLSLIPVLKQPGLTAQQEKNTHALSMPLQMADRR